MESMKKFLCCMGLLMIVFFSSCTTTHYYNFSLKNTLAIFMFNNGKDYYFSIPIQYIGDYQIQDFEFDSGFILIGDYKIVLERDDLKIDMFLNESSDEDGNTDGLGNLNQYNIILRKNINKSELKNIINEYEKGNTQSQFYVEYAITIDNEKMTGCGYMDDFELYNGPLQDGLYPPNLGFFWTWVEENEGENP